MINMILASTPDGGIGRDNTIPWRVSEDFKVFKAITENNLIVMGAKTWQSLPRKPLPNRQNIVISATLGPQAFIDEAGSVAALRMRSIEELLDAPEIRSIAADATRALWVIGGASIYKAFALHATYVHHTLINEMCGCDTFFDINAMLMLQLYDIAMGSRDVSFRLYYNPCSTIPRNQVYERAIREQVQRALQPQENKTEQQRVA